jgi:hypothetical protein
MMVKSIGAALFAFSDLPDEERELLFETFRVWQENDASVRAAAERLFCHPNTVRHGCVESRNTPADPSRGRGMSPSCVWLSRYTAV